MPIRDSGIDLIRAGFKRHRVLWVRQMAENDIRQQGDSGPTIDSIHVVEFESTVELKEWLGKTTAGFLQ